MSLEAPHTPPLCYICELVAMDADTVTYVNRSNQMRVEMPVESAYHDGILQRSVQVIASENWRIDLWKTGV